MLRKNRIIIISLIFIIFSFSLIYIQTKTNMFRSGYDKPSNLPQNSVWIGGIDESFWFEYVTYNVSDTTYRIRIYNDYDGSLNIDAEFKVSSSINPKDSTVIDNIFNWNNDKRYIEMIDGTNMYIFYKYFDSFEDLH